MPLAAAAPPEGRAARDFPSCCSFGRFGAAHQLSPWCQVTLWLRGAREAHPVRGAHITGFQNEA